MTRKEIEKTKWARDFKKWAREWARDFKKRARHFKNCSRQYEEAIGRYEEAINYAIDPEIEFEIIKVDKNCFNKRDCNWVICLLDFWMQVTKTKKEAIQLCKEMGWHIQRHSNG